MLVCLLVALIPVCTGYTIIGVPNRLVTLTSQRSVEPIACAVDEAQINSEADAFFACIDDDNNGLISFTELSEYLTTKGYTTQGIDHIFDLLDFNRDGEISKEELRESFLKFNDPALRSALGLGDRSTSEADAIFNTIDTNGDGQISKEELSAYLSSKGYAADVATNVFGALDFDNDGTISRLELEEGYESYSALRSILGLAAQEQSA